MFSSYEEFIWGPGGFRVDSSCSGTVDYVKVPLISVVLAHHPKNQERKMENRTKSISRVLGKIRQVFSLEKPYLEGHGKPL